MAEKKTNTNSRKKDYADLDLVDLTPRKDKSAKAKEISLSVDSQNTSRRKSSLSQNTSSFDVSTLNEKVKSQSSKSKKIKKPKKHSALKHICITIVLSIIGAVICFFVALKY